MQSKAKTVDEYLKSLPEDRRQALASVRRTILANLDSGFEEGMQYGMIGYFVPHRVFPAGYHCDPKQPLPYAGLAAQKNHLALYAGCLYGGDGRGGEAPELEWLKRAWAKSGKKLDMGKACIRFKKLEDVPLDVIGELFRRVSAATYVERYQGERARQTSKAGSAGAASKPAARKKIAAKAPAKAKAASKASPAKPKVSKAPPKKIAKKPAAKKTARKSSR